jgi:hypothetical protein
MNEQSFEATYAQMSDAELARVLRDKRDLVPLAVSALDREVHRRNLDPSQLRKLKPRSIDKPWRRTRMGHFSEEIGIEKLRSKRIRGIWLFVLIVLSTFLAFGLDHFGIPELFWPIVTTIVIPFVSVWGHWELKRRPWFWATIAFVTAGHAVFFHFVGWPWGTRWVPATSITGLWTIDIIAVFILIYFVEKLVHEDPNPTPRSPASR